jgi:DNA invertase Pin-like site-specific DNA recombinase
MDFAIYREVIPYARYSSPSQSLGTSEQRQVAAFEAFAAAHGVTLSSRRATDRGLSGYSGANLAGGALGALVEALQTGQIETPALLLVERQDRFGRQPSTQALVTLFSELMGRGCDIYHLHQSRLYSSEIIDSDFGALVCLAAEVHAAHHYSATLSQRGRAAKAAGRELIRKGVAIHPGMAPRWISPTATGWELNDYAPAVMRLVELIEGGAGCSVAARTLNADGIPSRTGKRWTPGSVFELLKNPALAGGRVVQLGTNEIAWDYYPALITRPRREALLAQVASRGRDYYPTGKGQLVRYLGQGLTTCADCGRAIGGCGPYLRCRGRVAGNCSTPWIRIDEAHAHLLTRLQPQRCN